MDRKRLQGRIGTIVFLVLLAVVIIGLFLRLTNREDNGKLEQRIETSEAQQLLAKDMVNNYPSTAREVLKLYCRVTTCLYNDELTDSERDGLVDLLRALYSDELLANNDKETMYIFAESDAKEYKKNKKSINSYTIDPASKIEYISDKHSDRAVINMFFTLKNGNSFERSYEEFVLKVSDDGYWKILGWRQR